MRAQQRRGCSSMPSTAPRTSCCARRCRYVAIRLEMVGKKTVGKDGTDLHLWVGPHGSVILLLTGVPASVGRSRPSLPSVSSGPGCPREATSSLSAYTAAGRARRCSMRWCTSCERWLPPPSLRAPPQSWRSYLSGARAPQRARTLGYQTPGESHPRLAGLLLTRLSLTLDRCAQAADRPALPLAVHSSGLRQGEAPPAAAQVRWPEPSL